MSSRQLSTIRDIPPSAQAALARAGYETLGEISPLTAEFIAKDLNVPIDSAKTILTATQNNGHPSPLFSGAQSAASIIQKRRIYCSNIPPLDTLLSGGLLSGQILELSGPPGCAKEALALHFVGSAVKEGAQVLFVELDMQNMTSAASISKSLPNYGARDIEHARHLVYYTKIHDLPGVTAFMHNLPNYLASHPNIALLVLNSLSFPFQGRFPSRTALLQRVRQTLSKACASKNLSVVITSQLSTKIVDTDGSPANFDTGARGVLVPSLGDNYLPESRTFRIMIALETPTSGTLRLLSSPKNPPRKGVIAIEKYKLVNGIMRGDDASLQNPNS